MNEDRPPKKSRKQKSAAQDGPSGLSSGQLRYHSRRRQKSHQLSQAEGKHEAMRIPDHPLIPKGEPEWINQPDQLTEIIDHLRQAGSFAYDTEFIGELSYYPRMCVIQAGTTERVALIDPLADIDLGPFWELVGDAQVETIVHAGAQDLEPVYRHTGEPPKNIFDTQIALGFAALPYPLSLRESVRLLVGPTLAKGSTFTQWDQRPLSSRQLEYAAGDVRFLPAVRAAAEQRLAELGHTDWAARECATLSDPAAYQFNPLASCRRIKGATRLNPRQLAALSAVVTWREEQARLRDAPARALVRDDALRTLAVKAVKTRADLRKVGVLPKALEDAHGDEILAAIASVADADVKNLPTLRSPEETGPERHSIDSLWALVQSWCFGRHVHPALVGTRGQIAQFCLNKNSKAASTLTEGWRGELLADLLGPFRQGETSLQFHWRDGGLQAERLNDVD